MSLLIRWFITAAAVAAAAWFVPGIHVEGGISTLLGVALLLGLLNALVRPLLKALACGLVCLTLGLFLFVLNAVVLLLTAWLAGHFGLGFRIDDFTSALVGAVVISVVSFLLSALLDGEGGEDR